MSTVMYCHKIHKNKLWQFCDKLRDFYKEKGIVFQLLHGEADLRVIMNDVVSNKEHYVSLQLFDEGSSFIFRVLSGDYLFLNNWDDFDSIQPLFYDNRSDIPPEHEANKEIAEWVDSQISNRQYFIVPIIDQEYLSRVLTEIRIEKAKEETSNQQNAFP